MAYEFYVTIESTKQGKLQGESTRKGQEGKLTGIGGFSYEVTSPRDAASGLATGKRQHTPVTFTKEWGANATLGSLRQYSAVDAAASARHQLEDFALIFESIEIENKAGKTIASDTWKPA